MITKIEVDGFKSLRDFTLNLKNGLNILVGPNGSGKTNIVLFFEFLSNIVSHHIGNSISNVGGAGSVFQKIGADEYNDTIKTKIYGCYESKTREFVVYEYSFEIKISFEKDFVYFSNQEINIRFSNKFWGDPDDSRYKTKWDLSLIYSIKDGKDVEVDIIKISDSFKSRLRSFFHHTKKDEKSQFKSFILSQKPIYHSIIKSLLHLTEFGYSLFLDLKGGETFNIIPSKVRELEDSASPPGIRKDGSGLATTLYALKKSKIEAADKFSNIYINFFDEPRTVYEPKILDKIISYLKAANSTITSLSVDNDPFNNKLLVKVKIETGDYEAILSLSTMSDGTIKWLTLITAILTSRTIFSIEEPENFLHPWMQAEIAKIMRNHINNKKSHSFVLMTTHSESLLNHANPEEIIVVDLKDGRTIAKRISNLKGVKEEISSSGFGLGHFYFSNALNDE